MINKEKIEYNVKKYWVPSHTNPRPIMILKEKSEGVYVVKSGQNEFLANIEHIYNKQEHASKGKKDWEHAERKRKKEEKEKSNQEL